ncbi:MAG: transcription elongation factor GreA [Bacilli bacterium]
MAANSSNIITKQGYQTLKEKLDKLVNVDKEKVLGDLALARSQGDLSENADYDAAREKLQQIETEISKIQYNLDHCTIVEETGSKGTCRLAGGTITVKNTETGIEYSFIIVGSAEADPIENRISNTCPVALACLGHSAGDTVLVEAKKPYNLLIEKVSA